MKERLTGAIILVVLIVLLVPELLSGPKGPAATPPAATSPNSSEEAPLRSYTINLGDDSHSQGATAKASGPAMPQPSTPEQPTAAAAASSSASDTTQEAPQAPAGTKSEVSRPEPAAEPSHPRIAPETRTAKVTAPASKPTAPAAAARTEAPKATGGWAVQLGVFASHENAERLALEVRVKGFRASVSPVTSGGRKLYRVRVGPTADRNAAQELQAKLKAAGRPAGTVVPYS